MGDKTYTLEVTERELARVMFVMGEVNGLTDGENVYGQAKNLLGVGGISGVDSAYRSLHNSLGGGVVDYDFIQEEWEKALGIGKFKKSPVQQRIENLEKELDELKKLL